MKPFVPSVEPFEVQEAKLLGNNQSPRTFKSLQRASLIRVTSRSICRCSILRNWRSISKFETTEKRIFIHSLHSSSRLCWMHSGTRCLTSMEMFVIASTEASLKSWSKSYYFKMRMKAVPSRMAKTAVTTTMVCFQVTLRWKRSSLFRVEKGTWNLMWQTSRTRHNFNLFASLLLKAWAFAKSLKLPCLVPIHYKLYQNSRLYLAERWLQMHILHVQLDCRLSLKLWRVSGLFSWADGFNKDGDSHLHCRIWFPPTIGLLGSGEVSNCFHLLIIPLFAAKNSGQEYARLTMKVRDIFCSDWQMKLLGLFADGARNMVGHNTGFSTRLRNESDCIEAF